MSKNQNQPAGRGRPRDPDLESRVYDAVLAIYAQSGWPGFSFDSIARAAEVGKSALYRRWASPADLLLQTLQDRWYRVADIDTGTLRGDLVALARHCLESLTGPYGTVVLHLQVDALRFPQVLAFKRKYSQQRVLEGRQIIARARARGELPPDVTATLILDIVVGGITNHVISTPASLRAKMITHSNKYIDDLVDLSLSGLPSATAGT